MISLVNIAVRFSINTKSLMFFSIPETRPKVRKADEESRSCAHKADTRKFQGVPRSNSFCRCVQVPGRWIHDWDPSPRVFFSFFYIVNCVDCTILAGPLPIFLPRCLPVWVLGKRYHCAGSQTYFILLGYISLHIVLRTLYIISLHSVMIAESKHDFKHFENRKIII